MKANWTFKLKLCSIFSQLLLTLKGIQAQISIDLYSGSSLSGNSSAISINTCAQNLFGDIASIDTHNNCIQLYNTSTSCTGHFLRVQPGMSHDNLDKYGYGKDIKSMGPCTKCFQFSQFRTKPVMGIYSGANEYTDITKAKTIDLPLHLNGSCTNIPHQIAIWDTKRVTISLEKNSCVQIYAAKNCLGKKQLPFLATQAKDMRMSFLLDHKDVLSYSACTPECPCPSGKFRCKDGQCIDPKFVCDRTVDCKYGEDERDCNGTTSTAEFFQTIPTITNRNETSTGIWVTPEGNPVEVYFDCNATCEEQRVFIQDYEDYVLFNLYTKETLQGVRIKPGSMENLDKFMNNTETKIVCHGFWSNPNSGMGPILRKAYLQNQQEDLNLIEIDWSKLASTWWYSWAVGYTSDVAKLTSRILQFIVNKKLASMDNMHFIGHSLGAHVGGLVGKYLRQVGANKIRRITCLDPAGPGYEESGSIEDANCAWYREPKDRITADDASFVDIIHTDTSLWGQICPTGHVDYYPNGPWGRQPACSFPDYICSHSISYSYFGESVENSFGFYGCECESSTELKNRACPCSQKDRVVMGEAAKLNAYGNNSSSTKRLVYLQTKSAKPYGCERSLSCETCAKKHFVSTFNNFFLSSENTPFHGTVVGGAEVGKNKVPWMVSLVSLFGHGTSPAGHICGGILLREDLVLTAAHCVDPDKIDYTFAMAGRHYLSQPLNPPTEQIRRVQFYEIHKNYYKTNDNKYFNDIALIYLESGFNDKAPGVAVAKLGRNSDYSNTPRIVTGWGSTGGGQDLSNVLLEAPLNSVNCANSYQNPDPAWFCAGNAQQGGCKGDSGGPLHISDGTDFWVVGTVSFGSGNCDSPTVFMNLEHYEQWITNGINACVGL